MNFLTILQASAPKAAQGGGTWSFLIMMILIFVVMWLLMIRPQQKKQKELAKFRNSLKKGDKVVTVGGLYGTVIEIKEGTPYLMISVDTNVKLKIDRNSVVKDISDVQR
ncbi:MAG: preprotein translocase subunit YajC [Bacteroidales bacterium]|jgi:preprotein translocase subunit YajC|nr:preprotein translocase subunit YajC [Bacteroidales bacterium]